MPNARVINATVVVPALFRNTRIPYRKSCNRVRIVTTPGRDGHIRTHLCTRVASARGGNSLTAQARNHEETGEAARIWTNCHESEQKGDWSTLSQWRRKGGYSSYLGWGIGYPDVEIVGVARGGDFEAALSGNPV